ncbi:MAG: ABC transporter permease subunit [Chloroflexota bacterium]|nr:MAG: ABC transporter permease subunit [Chloroflexota bacterium]
MAASATSAVRAAPTISRRTLVTLLCLSVVVLFVVFRGQGTLPRDEGAASFQFFNGVRDWVSDNRLTNPFLVVFAGATRAIIAALVDTSIVIAHGIGWPGAVLLAGAAGLAAGGRRLALLGVTGFLSLGVLGLWSESMDTIGLTFAAVVSSLLIGVPLGIAAGRSDRVRQVISPVLDLMQIMPSFAYLAPMTLLFLIGAPSATIATLIYAMPAAIRITALGIRGVSATTVEAAVSLGSTSRQTLFKVQLPLARKMLALAVNQTIMLALGMAVVTALIDGPGLGKTIIKALTHNDVGSAVDAGLAIVIIAIVLDRLTEHAANRVDARPNASDSARAVNRRVARVLLVAGLAASLVSLFVVALTEFPTEIGFSFAGPVNEIVGWVRINLYFLTNPVKDAFSYGVINPLEAILTSAPWLLIVGTFAGLGVLVGGWRTGAIVSVCLVGIAGLGLWEDGMVTLTASLVGVALTLLIGVLIGIAAARSERTSAILRPLLDTAQTMPSFVYLIPALALFSPTRFTAILAAVIYAVPPVIRLVEAGIRSVPLAAIEAGVSSGASPRQLLWKVQLPMARRSLLLAANQGIVMVLAMVVVGGLVGAGALGYDVVAGFSQYEDFGKGLSAGIAIVLLGVMLDRITQGAGERSSAGSARAG